MLRRGTVMVLLWLIVGAAAAGQRGYFSYPSIGCSQAATIIVTFVAGPLNYLGIDAKIDCKLPSPSGLSPDPSPTPARTPSVSLSRSLSHAGGNAVSSR